MELEPSCKARFKLLVLEAVTNGIMHHDKSKIVNFFEQRICAVCESAKQRGSSTIEVRDLAAVETVQWQPVGKK